MSTIELNSFGRCISGVGSAIPTSSDKFGKFRLKLLPGKYTFFLVINDMAYLNSFDKYGNFTSRSIDSRVDDLIITDFRGSGS